MAKKKGKGKIPRQVVARLREGESVEERAARLERENAVLRKEVDSLRMDREILKKAAAFFAKENE
jgi:transposase-like protein